MLIPISKQIRTFFPPKGVTFILETDVGEVETYIAGDSNEQGEELGGRYFSKNMHI